MNKPRSGKRAIAWDMGVSAARDGMSLHAAQVECAREFGNTRKEWPILDANCAGWVSQTADDDDLDSSD